jgi:hypothetical protein
MNDAIIYTYFDVIVTLWYTLITRADRTKRYGQLEPKVV